MAALNFPDPNVTTSYTNPDTGITYEWANGIWKAVRTAQTAPELFVDVDGDNLTGNLTLGTDKIVLNATDGNATFKGAVTGDRTSATARAFSAFLNGQEKTRIQADGSIFIGGNSSSAPIHLSNSGSAYFAGNFGIGATSVPTNFRVEIAEPGSVGLNLRNTNNSAGDIGRIAFSQGSGNLASANTFADIIATADTVSPLTGTLKFRTNQGNNVTEAMQIDSSGNVGIGTDSPGSLLQVGTGALSSNNVAAFLGGSTTFENTTTGSSPSITFNNDTDTGILNPSANTLGFNTGGTRAITISDAQRVGIGTTSPAAPLNVSDANHGIAAGYIGGTLPNTPGIYTSSSTAHGQAYGSLIVQARAEYSGYGISFRASNQERMRIDSSGNVGIGTSSPTTQAGKTLHLHNNDGQQRLHLTTNNTGSAAEDGLDIILEHNTDGNAHILNHETNGDLKLGAGNAERVRILSTGGLTFNGDTAQANALDDYEEGTWAPILGSSGGADFPAGPDNRGWYTRIGDLVFATATFSWAAGGTTAGAVVIRGWPFTAKNQTYYRSSNGLGDGTGAIQATGSFTGLKHGFDQGANFTWVTMHNYTLNTVNYSHYPTINGAGVIYGLNLVYQTD